jgi:hypothetical protein
MTKYNSRFDINQAFENFKHKQDGKVLVPKSDIKFAAGFTQHKKPVGKRPKFHLNLT